MGSKRTGEMDPDGQWGASWSGWLWRAWVALIGALAGLSLALFGIFERTTLSEGTWRLLSSTQSVPVWWLVIAALAPILGVSGAFIVLIAAADKRRVAEAEAKLNRHYSEREQIARDRDTSLAKLQGKERDYENLLALFRDRERLSMIDHVTGIPNYQCWEKDLREWASQGRDEKEYSLILVDLDNLKWLNERNRDGADQVLRYFAKKTYDSMRRDEHVYKVQEHNVTPSSAVEMYRHYQGGDEFFFIIGGDVYSAVGFVNRLAERINSYTDDVRDHVLERYLTLEDRREFRFSFSAVIAPIHPGAQPASALPNAYTVLDRAKKSTISRLLVVFDQAYEAPSDHRAELERRHQRLRARMASEEDSGFHGGESEQALSLKIALLRKAEQLFPPVRG